jgi:hypothetical protein
MRAQRKAQCSKKVCSTEVGVSILAQVISRVGCNRSHWTLPETWYKRQNGNNTRRLWDLPFIAIQTPHEPGQNGLKERIPNHGPYHEIQLPYRSRWCPDPSQRGIRNLGNWKRYSALGNVQNLCFNVPWPHFYWEFLGPSQSEPTTVDACQSTKTHLIFLNPILKEIVEIAKSPGNGTESSDAEERVEYL